MDKFSLVLTLYYCEEYRQVIAEIDRWTGWEHQTVEEMLVSSLIEVNDLDRASEVIATKLREETSAEPFADLNRYMGLIHIKRGNYSLAQDYLQTSLSLGLKINGDSLHPDIATSYGNIGSVYQLQGNYSSAMNYHQKNLEMQVKVHGDSPRPDIALSYNNIGAVCESQGDYTAQH